MARSCFAPALAALRATTSHTHGARKASASGTDDAVRLTPHIQFTLEEAIAYINDDELVEVTPNAIRLRKRYLDPHERKRMSKTI